MLKRNVGTPDRAIRIVLGIVITSYSIHYTKLYDLRLHKSRRLGSRHAHPRQPRLHHRRARSRHRAYRPARRRAEARRRSHGMSLRAFSYNFV